MKIYKDDLYHIKIITTFLKDCLSIFKYDHSPSNYIGINLRLQSQHSLDKNCFVDYLSLQI